MLIENNNYAILIGCVVLFGLILFVLNYLNNVKAENQKQLDLSERNQTRIELAENQINNLITLAKVMIETQEKGMKDAIEQKDMENKCILEATITAVNKTVVELKDNNETSLKFLDKRLKESNQLIGKLCEKLHTPLNISLLTLNFNDINLKSKLF
ncbi:unnamed protein product [Chironomus riparius]|uniref:Uncharacterized protein n=1 Tax=Chironomus riparius TaxID=315576 RepID=A0A9N9S1W2_9DIPT|nr:unnamed protein product [Chironomus riparius]